LDAARVWECESIKRDMGVFEHLALDAWSEYHVITAEVLIDLGI
jgi:hypothetical protein